MPENREPIRFVILDPGHFHAALALKRRRADVDPRVRVFAPDGEDLQRFLRQVEAFNARADDPTDWTLTVETGNDWRDRFRREPFGNTAVIAGRNKPKIDLILLVLEAGLNVLADKPWIVDAADAPKLARAGELAKRRGLVAWDLMTERHETTNRLLLALVREPAIFGEWKSFSLESVHCLKKMVAGAPLSRPAWWFDEREAGDSLADVGTHLVDLAFRALAPVRPDAIRIDGSRRWPLLVERCDFEAVTGLPEFPPEMQLVGERLRYAGNGTVEFALGGVPVHVTTRWELEHPGGDWHAIVAHGRGCSIHSEQSPDGRRTIAIRPASDGLRSNVIEWCARQHAEFPGVSARVDGDAIRLLVPDSLHRDHESLFGHVVDDYARLFGDPSAMPEHEWPTRLARYAITTSQPDRCSRAGSPVP
jgi:predicted dehydrogenase